MAQSKYNCIVLIGAHSEVGSEIKELETIKQTTIAPSPGICNSGSKEQYVSLLRPYEHKELVINEDVLIEQYGALKSTMTLDTTTPEKNERVRRFLEDPGIMTNRLIRQYREKTYHFFDREGPAGFILIIVEGLGIMDIRDTILDIIGRRIVTKTDIFQFLEGSMENVLYLDMSCNGTESREIMELIGRDKIVGGKKSRKRIKTKRRKRI